MILIILGSCFLLMLLVVAIVSACKRKPKDGEESKQILPAKITVQSHAKLKVDDSHENKYDEENMLSPERVVPKLRIEPSSSDPIHKKEMGESAHKRMFPSEAEAMKRTKTKAEVLNP